MGYLKGDWFGGDLYPWTRKGGHPPVSTSPELTGEARRMSNELWCSMRVTQILEERAARVGPHEQWRRDYREARITRGHSCTAISGSEIADRVVFTRKTEGSKFKFSTVGGSHFARLVWSFTPNLPEWF